MDAENVRRSNQCFSENVSILVSSESSRRAHSEVQICPAVLLPSQQAIPNAVKHIYNGLAAKATQVDQGMPDLIIPLIATGNTFDLEKRRKVEKGLSRIVEECGVWMITSGEYCDPLAIVASSITRKVLPNVSLHARTTDERN
ncbi:hypothetical protein AB6A40_001035 [Gnathostoma spinigerum]|uniref:Uncharacterized protein n=1 Tax=Gnathostoma spinigerum TaxID=75299 RepID=A0ABD6E5G7_9BILA